MLGIGAMLHALGGGSEIDQKDLIGKVIKKAELKDDVLRLEFEDGVVELLDDGQSCCESRYITTDDDPSTLTGELLSIEVAHAKDEVDEWGETHEQAFVKIQTANGFVTLCTHNQHNGYYGGFGLTLRKAVDT